MVWYAVTQDIEVGSKAFYVKFPDTIITINNQDQLNNFSKGELMKILGELPRKAARFVKDGDEIDIQWRKNMIIYDDPIEGGTIQVKCSQCNTYH